MHANEMSIDKIKQNNKDYKEIHAKVLYILQRFVLYNVYS